MISFSNKFIYIHVPKCGGTSVLNKIGYLTTFNKSGWGKQDHSFMSETKTHLSNQNFEEYYKFTIVRNTWNRLASLWGHNKEEEIIYIIPFVKKMKLMLLKSLYII